VRRMHSIRFWLLATDSVLVLGNLRRMRQRFAVQGDWLILCSSIPRDFGRWMDLAFGDKETE